MLNEREKEIAAIAASVAGHCQPCLEHHLSKARDLGIENEEIEKIYKIAGTVSDKGDERMMEFALNALKNHNEIPVCGCDPGCDC